MTYKTTSPLPKAALGTLKTLYSKMPELTQPNEPLHLGDGGVNRPSVFEDVKWFDMTSGEREKFKSTLPSKVVEKAVNGWFLRFPPRTGRLDRMTHWEGQALTGSIVAYSLDNNQEFYINDERFVLQAGEGVVFPLNIPHEVKPSKHGQRWACVLVMGDAVRLVD